MTLDEQLEQLAAMQCPRQVDVTDRVMQQVASRPYLRPTHHAITWKRVGAVAAVLTPLIFAAIYLAPLLHSYDDEGLANSMAQYNDYAAWNPVEEVAANPYDFLYEE